MNQSPNKLFEWSGGVNNKNNEWTHVKVIKCKLFNNENT